MEPQTDLIKTVRGLDQSGPGQDGETLDLLWTQMTASADGRFHAAEESSLRWLLKSMNGSTAAAETLRRYQLTWRLLGCVMQRIPLFSLAKSLADRKFIQILQQTLKEISQPRDEAGSKLPSKRKRSSPPSFSLTHLKTASGCLATGTAIFEALDSLFRRLQVSTVKDTTHDRVGAEHLKSLFGTPAQEMVLLVAPLLQVCSLLLDLGHPEECEGSERWIETISTTWSLHLQSNDDVAVVARQVFPPVAVVMSKLGELSDDEASTEESTLKTQWSLNLQKFMQSNFILPSRAAFLNRQDDGPIIGSLEASEHRLDVAAPALYFLTSETSQQLAQRGLRQGNNEWMKRIFQAVSTAIAERQDRAIIMQKVVRQARERAMPVNINDLRTVCRQYGLLESETDWALIADLVQCEPDVFQGESAGAELLSEVCKRIAEERALEANQTAIAEIIEAMARGFKTARDFSAFLKLWYSQLSDSEQRKLKFSPWTPVGRKNNTTSSLPSWIEQELSMQQLVDILTWVEEQGGSPKTLCLWLNIFTEGIGSNDAKDAVGQKVFDLVKKVKKTSSEALSLKWRVVSRTFAWTPLSQRAENWAEIKDSLKKTLKKTPTETEETFEAFKCCSRLWVSLSPDAEQLKEVAQLVEDFSARLAIEMEKTGAIEGQGIPTSSEAELEFDIEHPLRQYLAWYLRGATRLNRLYFEKEGTLLTLVQRILATSMAEPHDLEPVWKSLLDNEHCVNDAKLAESLLNRAIENYEAARKGGSSLDENTQVWMRLISTVPLDAISRQQRERIMANLFAVSTSTVDTKPALLESWKLVLSLETKLMSRPTFYERMSFQDLVETADAVSKALVATTAGSHILLEMVSRFSNMAAQTIRQMAGHVEERSIAYFKGAKSFIDSFKALIAQDSAEGVTSPLRLTLLKALSNELSQSAASRSNESLASIPAEAQLVLGTCVASVMGEWASGKKLFSMPNVLADFRLLAAVDAADVGDKAPEMQKHASSSLRKLEKRSLEAMKEGDLRSWKMQTFLQKYLSSELEIPRPASFHHLPELHGHGGESLLREYVGAIVQSMDGVLKMMYLESLVGEYQGGCDTDGQLVAIQFVVGQLIGKCFLHIAMQCRLQLTHHPEASDTPSNTGEFDLATATTELTRALAELTKATNAIYICRTLYNLLERKPQVINQANIEGLLAAVAVLSSRKPGDNSAVPFIWLCKLVEVIIKKHRLRLEGHYHLLLAALQPLLRNLVLSQRSSQGNSDVLSHESKATAFGRLITLMCEPTAGAVARSQHHSTLDSATDEAKRTAGRHMYLVIMQYVKLQLETDISRGLREALEPAMNTIFDITPPEGRKILNDAMDASGRAILREMFKRYTKFGKWSGV